MRLVDLLRNLQQLQQRQTAVLVDLGQGWLLLLLLPSKVEALQLL